MSLELLVWGSILVILCALGILQLINWVWEAHEIRFKRPYWFIRMKADFKDFQIVAQRGYLRWVPK